MKRDIHILMGYKKVKNCLKASDTSLFHSTFPHMVFRVHQCELDPSYFFSILEIDADEVLKIWSSRLRWEVSSEESMVLSKSSLPLTGTSVGPDLRPVLLSHWQWPACQSHCARSAQSGSWHCTASFKLICRTAIHSNSKLPRSVFHLVG